MRTRPNAAWRPQSRQAVCLSLCVFRVSAVFLHAAQRRLPVGEEHRRDAKERRHRRNKATLGRQETGMRLAVRMSDRLRRQASLRNAPISRFGVVGDPRRAFSGERLDAGDHSSPARRTCETSTRNPDKTLDSACRPTGKSRDAAYWSPSRLSTKIRRSAGSTIRVFGNPRLGVVPAFIFVVAGAIRGVAANHFHDHVGRLAVSLAKTVEVVREVHDEDLAPDRLGLAGGCGKGADRIAQSTGRQKRQ